MKSDIHHTVIKHRYRHKPITAISLPTYFELEVDSGVTVSHGDDSCALNQTSNLANNKSIKPRKFAPFGTKIPVEEFAKLGVIMGTKRWERVLPYKHGEINAIPNSRGMMVAQCEDGRCLIERLDGSAFIGHKDWFIEDEPTSLDEACNMHNNREAIKSAKRRISKVPEELIVLEC